MEKDLTSWRCCGAEPEPACSAPTEQGQNRNTEAPLPFLPPPSTWGEREREREQVAEPHLFEPGLSQLACPKHNPAIKLEQAASWVWNSGMQFAIQFSLGR